MHVFPMVHRINSIKWLAFVMETECVFCEAETKSLNFIWMTFRLQREGEREIERKYQ
jgi:hypothetical protein